MKMLSIIPIVALIFNAANTQMKHSNKALATIPFEMNGSHIMVNASVNGSEEFPFVFDTGGGSSLIDAGKAESIGLQVTSKQQGMGAAGVVEFSISSGNYMQLGNLTFDQSSFVMTSLDHMKGFKSRSFGVLGYQEISKYVVEIDYEQNEISFFDKDTYVYSGTGTEVPIGLEMRIPSIDANMVLNNGTKIEGRFLIDTGAGLSASMNTPAVKQYDAISSLKKSIITEAAGATSSFQLTNGRIKSLNIGAYSFNNLPISFSQAAHGAAASHQYVGLIGNDIMKRFKIILDYQNERMILEPNKLYSDPFGVNASGMFIRINDEGNQYVHRIFDGSPAAKAGLNKGDILLSVDETKCTDENRHTIRRLLQADGQKVDIVWQQNGQTKSASVKLKNQY